MNSREDIYKITSIVLMIDQIIKLIINNTMTLYEQIKIIPNFFTIFYVKNTGAAFSLLENNTTFLIIISVIFIFILDRFIKKEKSFTKFSVLSLGMIMGGIFGNLIDRIIHHGVIDYLAFKIINYEFPVFNIADICITLGVIILIYSMFFEKKPGGEND
jgi:signal peptidase II